MCSRNVIGRVARAPAVPQEAACRCAWGGDQAAVVQSSVCRSLKPRGRAALDGTLNGVLPRKAHPHVHHVQRGWYALNCSQYVPM